jgi:hypothetical protein
MAVSLRRYSNGKTDQHSCGYHDASVRIEDAQASDNLPCRNISSPSEALAFDQRWPTHCACGYEFTDADEFQFNVTHLYQCSGVRGDLYPARCAGRGDVACRLVQ